MAGVRRLGALLSSVALLAACTSSPTHAPLRGAAHRYVAHIRATPAGREDLRGYTDSRLVAFGRAACRLSADPRAVRNEADTPAIDLIKRTHAGLSVGQAFDILYYAAHDMCGR